jgi:hypothetical protein
MADIIEEALDLINLDPPPADIEQRLKELEQRANENEAVEFPWVWEAWSTRQDELGPTPTKV